MALHPFADVILDWLPDLRDCDLSNCELQLWIVKKVFISDDPTVSDIDLL